MLTQEYLKSILHYDPESGAFTWINSGRRGWRGKPAGSLFNLKRSRTSYLRIKIKNKNYLAHRLAWLYMYGEMPDSILDHIDENGLNNSISNIRASDESKNIQNVSLKANNTSGYKNVSWFPQTGKWRVSFRLKIDGVSRMLSFGLYSNIKDAIKVAAIKREELHEEFANHG